MSADDDLRTAFQGLADGAASPPCVPSEEIYDAVAGDLPPERVHAIVDHVSACPACAESWRIAMAIVAEPPSNVIAPDFGGPREPVREALSEPRPARSWAWPALAGLALAAVALVGVGPALLSEPQAEAPVYRDAGDAGLRTGSPTLRLPSGQDVDVALAWTGAPEGSTFEVVVTDEALRDVAHARGLSRPEWVLPGEHVRALEPGSALLWRVEATTPSGERIASPTWRIAVE